MCTHRIRFTTSKAIVDALCLPVKMDVSQQNAKKVHFLKMDVSLGHHVASHHITSPRLTPHHIISPRLTSQSHHTSHHITSPHLTSHHITSHHITSHHITSHHITSHHITSHQLHCSTSLHHITTQRKLLVIVLVCVVLVCAKRQNRIPMCLDRPWWGLEPGTKISYSCPRGCRRLLVEDVKECMGLDVGCGMWDGWG